MMIHHNENGSDSCVSECPYPAFGVPGYDTVCRLCVARQCADCTKNLSVCVECDYGYLLYVTDDNETTCLSACPGGYYGKPYYDRECRKCPLLDNCSACEDINGDCLSCRLGYRANGHGCSPCELNMYKDNMETQCIPCPDAQFHISATGSTKMSDCICNSSFMITEQTTPYQCVCPSGMTFNGSHCVSCPSDHYKSVPGRQSCLKCDATRTSPSGSISVDACLCRAGFFNPIYAGKPQDISCVLCSDGAVCDGGNAKPRAKPGMCVCIPHHK